MAFSRYVSALRELPQRSARPDHVDQLRCNVSNTAAKSRELRVAFLTFSLRSRQCRIFRRLCSIVWRQCCIIQGDDALPLTNASFSLDVTRALSKMRRLLKMRIDVSRNCSTHFKFETDGKWMLHFEVRKMLLLHDLDHSVRICRTSRIGCCVYLWRCNGISSSEPSVQRPGAKLRALKHFSCVAALIPEDRCGSERLCGRIAGYAAMSRYGAAKPMTRAR